MRQVMKQETFTEVTAPKSRMSTNSIMPAYMSGRVSCRNFVVPYFYTARNRDEA